MELSANPQKQYELLTAVVGSWDRRLRTRQTVTWLARPLLVSLIVAVSIALVSRLQPWLDRSELTVISLVLVSAGVMGTLLAIWVWPRTPLQSARRFDLQFGLQERVSTAMEISAGNLHTAPDLAEHQLADAFAQAQQVEVQKRIPLEPRYIEWIAVIVLAVILVILIGLPNLSEEELAQNANRQRAVAAAADEVQDAIEEIAADTSLDEEEREALLEALETDLETLQDENITEEEAIATANDVSSMLNDQAAELEEQIDADTQGLEGAAEALRDPEEPEPIEGIPAGTQVTDELAEMGQELETGAATDAEAMAQSLEDAADALEETNPEAAEALREAAEALRAGDQEAAQESLQEAGEQVQEQTATNEQLQELAEQMNQSAEEMQQMAEEMGQEESDSEQSGEGEEGEEGDDGQTSQEGGGEQPGDPGADTAEGDQSGGGQKGDGEQGGNTQEGDPGNAQASGRPQDGASEAGSQAASPGADTTGIDPSEEIQGGGEEGVEDEFESIFAPNRPEMEVGDDEIVLEPDAGDIPATEGQITENPEGEVTVPYNQVFGDYANAANEALDQGYVPLGLRGVVRDYFTSLAPKGE